MRQTKALIAEGELPTWQQVQDNKMALQHNLGYVGVSLLTEQESRKKQRPDLLEFRRRSTEVRQRLLCQGLNGPQTYRPGTPPEPKWWRVARHLGLIVLSAPFYLIDAVDGNRRVGDESETYVLYLDGDIVPLAHPYAYGLKDLRVRSRDKHLHPSGPPR